jgi:hypothetical protein
MEAIMDLIGSINYIENRLGGRKSNQEKGKPAHKKDHDETKVETGPREKSTADLTEYDTRLGHKLDTTA